ncbi:hypothetical protein AB8A05_15405 [Tardiphaga sp. 538_B7_N1_4]|uniref:hypothetical protein n=1 Tax=Tardiphaga sp. 538_B7_N1_4 TaxID=3240778 RepID=UPI003F28C9E7
MFHISRAFAWLDASRDFSAANFFESVRELNVTRRQLLVGAAATTVSVMVPAGAAGNLKISSSRDQIIVELEERAWVIDRATFGPAARLRYWEEAGAHFISVDRSPLPGLSRRADFDAILSIVAGQWRLALQIFDAKFDVPFLAWLDGKHAARVTNNGYFAARRAGSRAAYLECMPRSAEVEITPRWQVRLRADAPIASLCIDGLSLQSSDIQLTLGTDRRSSALDLVSSPAPAAAAKFDFLAPSIVTSTASPGQVGSETFELTFDAVRSAQATITLQQDGSQQAILSLVGEAAVDVSMRTGDTLSVLSGLRLAPAGLVASVLRKSEQRLLVATVAQAAHEIDTPNVVLSVAGNESSRIAAVFENRLSAPIEVETEIYSAAVPVAGADTGRIQFAPMPLDIVIGRAVPKSDALDSNVWLSAYRARANSLPYVQAAADGPEAACIEKGKTRGLLVAGPTPYFMAPLEQNTWLQVLRSQDLLSLKFGFRNFNIEVRNGRAELVPRSLSDKFLDGAKFDHKLLVEFPPQHISEEAIRTQLGIGSTPVKNLDFHDRTLPPTSGIPNKPQDDFPPVVKARLSGPTRLVFREKDPVRKALSVRTLTDWKGLAQVVSERAMRTDTPLEKQLEVVGIDKSTSRAEALVKIIQSIRPPRDDETAIEFPYRLILSPDDRAQWITPQRPLGALNTPTLLWNARLNLSKGGQSVRAVWARDILLDFLRGNLPADNVENRSESNEPPFVQSLSRSDRRELVTLSSVYGLPALQRVVLDKDKALNNALNPGSPTPIPPTRDPAGGVQPFPANIGLWKYDGKRRVPVPDEGIYVPKPLALADLSLTAMGATFVGEGQWEPPSPIVLPFDVNLPDIDHNWRPSLRLERWNHRAVLGRDIYVEVAYKGFLFPIGHRASLLKVSERRFFPHPETKKTTAYLIQRLFIVVGKREKNFPALGQPFDGRPWPAHLVTMAAGRTPDLKDPEERGNQQVNGRLLFNDASGAPLNGLVFWPRIGACSDATNLGADGNIIAADKKEVAFQFRKDEDTQPISAPLLFIDNVAAHEPSTMQAVLDYYRKTLPDGSPLRQATHGSVRRRYAPPVKDGETELDTQSWDLSATGRYIAADATKGVAESFAVDGMMEGADQPPFYPVIRTTNIKVQSVDRMIGTPAGSMTAAFNESYVRHGFAPDQNPSELFLDVLSPAIYLNFAGAGDAVGGLAKPNARLVALSRKFGPVGGKAPPPPSKTSGAFGLFAANPPPTTPAPIGGIGGLPPRGDYSSFASGVLDPKEFLGGADSLPKLLGIFSLADVLKAVAFTNSGSADEQEKAENKVPKLQETTGFSGIGADLAAQLSNVKDVFKKMADDFIGPPPGTGGIVGDTLKQIETTIQSRLGTNFNWRTLYPRLSAAFDNLRNALDAARTQAKNTTDPAQLGRLIPYGSAVVTAGKALIAEVGAVRDNPMPPLVGDILAELAGEWDNLRRFAQLVINGKDLPEIIGGVKKDAVQYFDQFYTDLRQIVAVQTAVETQTLIDLVLSVVPSAPYVFSTAVVENEPGEGKLALNNGVQKDATAIYANLTDGEGNQIASLIDALDGSPLNGLGYLRISDASDDKKWLLFRLKELWSQRNYRKFVVEPTAASGNAPLTKDIVLAYIPYLDFNALDPAAIAKSVANTLLYEVAGEQIISAYAAVTDLAKALSGAIDANARDIGAKLTTVTAKLFDAALAMAQAAEKSGVMANVTNWCDQAMEFVIDVSDKVIGVGDDLSKRIVDISKNAAAIKVPPGAPADIRAKVDQARASLIQAQERLSRCLASLDVHRKQIRTFATQCTRIHHALSLSGKIMVLRRDALAALQDIILQARMVAAAIDEIAPAQFKNFATADDDLQDTRNAVYELVNSVTELLQGLTSIKSATSGAGPGTVLARIQANVTMLTGNLTGRLDHYKKEIEGARDEFMAAAGSLQARASQIVLDVERWKDSNGKKPFPPDLAAVGSDVLSYAVKHDRRFAALVLQSTQTFNTAKQQLEGTAIKILGIITTPLLEVHKIAIAGAERILPLIDKDSAPAETKDRAEFLSAILAPGVVAAFKDLSRIKQDHDSLLAIKQAGTAQAAFDAAFAIKDRWSGQDPALVRKIEEVSRIVDSLAHGQLSELVNLDGIRALVEEQIKDALLSFIPTKVDLAYDWKTNLQPFANIFEMRNSADDDLTLAVRTSIDLLRPESRSTRVTGTLKGFRVHILGKSSGSGDSSVGNFLSIYFSGAEFTSINGSRPDFKADIDDVKIGPALEFIRQLGQYLSYSGSGGGFYVRLTLSPLGIEAGFEFSEDIISLGAITFFNVGFSISAQLPFQDRDARFRFALASADAPFMVSVLPCYGGGGFFAITSNGREIVQAECSAEFGAIVGLKFGPLTASGRVMAGIYIRQAQGGGAFIKGFVHAVGEGHIACFSVTVNIEVCIVHLPSGTMYGQSSYRFTFKVGFAEVGYGVTATYSIASKGGEGGGGNAELVAFVQPAVVAEIMKTHPSCHLHERKFITTRVPSKSRRWARYRERIDTSLLKD